MTAGKTITIKFLNTITKYRSDQIALSNNKQCLCFVFHITLSTEFGFSYKN